MTHSACDNGPGRARGWPTSQQGGPEVNPADPRFWAEEMSQALMQRIAQQARSQQLEPLMAMTAMFRSMLPCSVF